MPTHPGMTERPARSRTRAPAGAAVDAAGPTAVIRPLSITIVWSLFAGRPVPSITRTCCSAMIGASMEMKSCVTCGSARRCGGGAGWFCAASAANANSK
jgi:hypothetical protein